MASHHRQQIVDGYVHRIILQIVRVDGPLDDKIDLDCCVSYCLTPYTTNWIYRVTQKS
jgi:hypothetical protein